MKTGAFYPGNAVLCVFPGGFDLFSRRLESGCLLIYEPLAHGGVPESPPLPGVEPWVNQTYGESTRLIHSSV